MPPGAPRKLITIELLQAMSAADDPVLTVSEISENFDVKENTIYKRLERMIDADIVNAKIVGSSAKVYWLSDKGYRLLYEVENNI